MKTLRLATLALSLLLAAGTAQAGWIGAVTGSDLNDVPHNYTNVANWVGGVIDDNFTNVTFTGSTVLHFTADYATGLAGLNTSYIGNQKLKFDGRPTPVTLTLKGDVTHRPVGTGELSFGDVSYGQLRVDLGGAVRAFHCGTSA